MSTTTFTYNGVEYNTDDLSDKANAIVALLQRTQEQLDIFGVAKESLLLSLEEELNPPKLKATPAIRKPLSLAEVE